MHGVQIRVIEQLFVQLLRMDVSPWMPLSAQLKTRASILFPYSTQSAVYSTRSWLRRVSENLCRCRGTGQTFLDLETIERYTDLHCPTR